MEGGPVWGGPHQSHDAGQVLLEPWISKLWREPLVVLVPTTLLSGCFVDEGDDVPVSAY